MSKLHYLFLGALFISSESKELERNLLEYSQAADEERGLDAEVRLCPTPSSAAAADKRNSNVILVSTLDGKLTALDPSDEGRLLWSIDTKPGDMVSSTIRLILHKNCKRSHERETEMPGLLYFLQKCFCRKTS